MPAMSSTANGPIAMPNPVSASSTCCGVAPSSTRYCASYMYGNSIRLPTKPGQLPTTTPTLPSRLASAMAVAMTAGLVAVPRTISSSRITLAGLKKCRPMTSDGPRRRRGNRVDVDRRGVGRQDAAGPGHRVELAKHLLLQREVLEHRLDDQVHLVEARRVQLRMDARRAARPRRPR